MKNRRSSSHVTTESLARDTHGQAFAAAALRTAGHRLAERGPGRDRYFPTGPAHYPFLLLAAACFARSSPRFYQWLVEHPRLGPWIRDYLDGNGIPLKGKVYAIGLMWLSIGISCYLVPLPWARGFMLTSAVLVTVYILRQKTLPPR